MSSSKSEGAYVFSEETMETRAPQTINVPRNDASIDSYVEVEEMHIEDVDVEEIDGSLHPPKKRKEGRQYIQSKSKRKADYWKHFREYVENGKLRAECKYCEDKSFACDSTINGSKNVKNHWDRCPSNPKYKTRGKQIELVLEPLDGEKGEGKLRNWTLNVNEVRDALSFMVMVDELPFRFVEKPGFKHFMSVACPRFHMPSRITVTRDCYQLYLKEKVKLKEFLRNSCQRVCITPDTWTSIQRINYMCLTAYFIDKDWKLHKRILNFCPISSHKGEAIGKAIEDCLISWDLEDKLYTVTVDNASSNDVACAYLKRIMQRKGCIHDGKWLHMRCIAHIINLVVWDGLKENMQSVDKVRAAVKYVRNSPARLQRFKELAEKYKVECRSSLSLDVPTRWNSTYTMLDIAVKFQDIFDRMNVPLDLESLGPPQEDDWKKVKSLIVFLKEFYALTNRVSGSLYVTSNSVFFEIGHALETFEKWLESDDADFRLMAFQMKAKYDKYWGDVEKINVLIYMGAILDPKVKMVGVQFAFHRMYGAERGEVLAQKVCEAAYALFEEYRNIYAPVGPQSEQNETIFSNTPISGGGGADFKKAIEYQVKMMSGSSGRFIRSEFDRYLHEQLGKYELDGDILSWWKLNAHRFPVLACLARDVLAIPISTVASESAFSAGGRHLDPFRSSLTPKMVQALICGQDWLRAKSINVDVEEKLEELEELEKDLQKIKMDDDIVFVE